MRVLAAGYRHGRTRFVRAGLIWIHGLGVAFALISSSLLLPLYSGAPVGAIALVAGLSLVPFLVDAAVVMRTARPALDLVDSWQRDRAPDRAAATWEALADIPFAPLRSAAAHAAAAALLLGWSAAAAWRMGLAVGAVPVLFGGALLIWLYWLALRVFATERFLRPALADVSTTMTDDERPGRLRMRLFSRVLVVLPAIAVIGCTAVAGMAGDRPPRALAFGAAATLISAAIATWLLLQVVQSITEPIEQLRAVAARVGLGDLQARVPVVSVDEIGSLARSFNAMVAGLRERQHIRDTFGVYVDPDVVEHVLAHGPALSEGDEVEITALFLDVRGFTGFSESHSAREVVGMLNRLFDLVVPIITGHGGHVDKFIGDGLLAVFGTPRPLADHAGQAVTAALEIAAATRDRPGEPDIGIGLNSGAVVAGNLGGGGRFDFSVIGDVVNVAARVESATRQTGDTLLVSEHTQRLLPPHLRARLVERTAVPLKGRSRRVALHAPR
jgi:adenylate cyclase